MPGQDGADEYIRDRNLILKSLEDQSEQIEKLGDKLDDHSEKLHQRINAIDRDVVMLKVKSGLWGATAGAVTVGLALATKFLA